MRVQPPKGDFSPWLELPMDPVVDQSFLEIKITR